MNMVGSSREMKNEMLLIIVKAFFTKTALSCPEKLYWGWYLGISIFYI